MAADSGIFLGDYELLGELGEGGMGKVYFARHRQQIGLVAVKVPKMEVLEKEGGAAAFLAEIATNSRFQHPRIARVYTSGTHSDGQLYLVMPLFEGGAGKAFFLQAARAYEKIHPEVTVDLYLDPRIQEKVQVRFLEGSFFECTNVGMNYWPLIDNGSIAPAPQSRFRLTQVSAAHTHLESGDNLGKVVLTVSRP